MKFRSLALFILCSSDHQHKIWKIGEWFCSFLVIVHRSWSIHAWSFHFTNWSKRVQSLLQSNSTNCFCFAAKQSWNVKLAAKQNPINMKTWRQCLFFVPMLTISKCENTGPCLFFVAKFTSSRYETQGPAYSLLQSSKVQDMKHRALLILCSKVYKFKIWNTGHCLFTSSRYETQGHVYFS